MRLQVAYTKLGPAGLSDSRSLMTSGLWFLFGGSYALAATRVSGLAWMLRLFAKRGSTDGETRVRLVLAGGLCVVVGALVLIRGLVLYANEGNAVRLGWVGL
jgi:hypothetical protein